MLNIVEPVIKLCWVRYICYAGIYFCDSNDHIYRNVNGYGYPMGTRYPWWVGLDKMLVARWLARFVVSSARLGSARLNFVTS
jgi:hypothetical protein